MEIRKKKFLMNRPGYLTWGGGLRMPQDLAKKVGVLQDSVKTVAWLPAKSASRAVLPGRKIANKVVFLRRNARQEEQHSTRLFFRTNFNGKKQRLVKGFENHCCHLSCSFHIIHSVRRA